MENSNHLVEEDGYRIWVGMARGLHNADRYGKSDPYAIVKIGGREVFRTRVIDDSLDPCWNLSVVVPVSKVNHLMAQEQRREVRCVCEGLGSGTAEGVRCEGLGSPPPNERQTSGPDLRSAAHVSRSTSLLSPLGRAE